MREEIRNAYHRIIFVLADYDFYQLPVLFRYHPVYRKGKGNPLIFLDSAVVVGVKVSKSGFFIKGILFCVKPRRVYVRPQNVHSLFYRFFPHDKKHHCF